MLVEESSAMMDPEIDRCDGGGDDDGVVKTVHEQWRLAPSPTGAGQPVGRPDVGFSGSVSGRRMNGCCSHINTP